MTPSQSHSDAPPSRFRPRTAATIAAMVLLAALVAGGLALHFAHRDGHPGNSKSALRQIARHLKKHTGENAFTAALPASWTDVVAASQPAAATDRSERSSRNRESQSRRGDGTRNEFSREFRQKLSEATDYKTIYRVIGEHLEGARQLLAQENAVLIERGIQLAVEASEAAVEDAYDHWLAARIAEAYLWPQVARLDASSKSRMNPDRLLGITDNAFRQAGENRNIISNFQLQIDTSKDRGRADAARYRLAQFLEEEKLYGEALDYLRQIEPGGNTNWQHRIAQFERQLRSELN